MKGNKITIFDIEIDIKAHAVKLKSLLLSALVLLTIILTFFCVVSVHDTTGLRTIQGKSFHPKNYP
jgi:hypothetical protein